MPVVVSRGIGCESEVIEKIETLTGVPATTSIVAGMQALKALSVRRLGIVNPYPAELTKAVVGFLNGHGFEVGRGCRLSTNSASDQTNRIKKEALTYGTYSTFGDCDGESGEAS